MDTRELAWAAGLFEGEGWISDNSGYAMLGLETTDMDTLERFHAAVGGLGRISGHRVRGGNRPVASWKLCSFEGSQAVLAMLWYGLGDRRKSQARGVFAARYQPKRIVRRPPVTRSPKEG